MGAQILDVAENKHPNDKPFGKSRYFIAFIIGSLIIGIFFILPTKEPLMMISAQSRSVSFMVSNSDESTIRFQNQVLVTTDPTTKGTCMTGLAVPSNNAELFYDVVRQSLLIRASSKSSEQPLTFIANNDRRNPVHIGIGGSLYYGIDSGCDEEVFTAVRLPIWGTAKLGSVPTPPTLSKSADSIGNILLSGDVKVFGRNLFGSGVYPAGDFSLPAGSQLFNDKVELTSPPEPWFGFAIYDAQSNSIAPNSYLVVNASTIAERLHLKRLGGGAVPEKIDVGFLTKIIGDPLLSGIGAFLAFLFFLSEFMLAIRSLRKED